MVTPRHQPNLDFAPVILVVDDDEMIRELCREALARDDRRVLTAANGEEALALADRWMLDVLVTDIGLPGLDGFGLCRALRRRYPGMSAIAMTADADYQGRSVQQVATEHGIVRTFLKPFDVSFLCEAVRGECEASAHVATTGSSTHRPIPETRSEAHSHRILAECASAVGAVPTGDHSLLHSAHDGPVREAGKETRSWIRS